MRSWALLHPRALAARPSASPSSWLATSPPASQVSRASPKSPAQSSSTCSAPGSSP